MNYSTLCELIHSFEKKYKVQEIGTSHFNRKIFAVGKIINRNLPTAILVASTHAREHITTDLVCKFFLDGLFDDEKAFNVVAIPMLNPDGVELSSFGVESAPTECRENLIDINQGSFDFSLWKANGRGVDLNNNFDARFNSNVHSLSPSPSGYPGKVAESENETRAVVKFLEVSNPFIVLSFHSKGEELYFNFFQEEKLLERDKIIAERFSKSTGYAIKNPENVSSGGLKDYCVSKLKIPSITFEVGSDKLSHPISSDALDEIFERHKSIAKDLQFAYNVYRMF